MAGHNTIDAPTPVNHRRIELVTASPHLSAE